MPDSEQPDLTRLTVDLLSAYFANNSVPSSELPALIDQTRSALAGESTSAAKTEVHKPAVSVEDSIASKEHILSLIDGKPYKSLKRHLANNGLTPAEYRSRYDLAADYPMVAPAYSEHRRAVAQRMGLGGRPGAAKGTAATSASSAAASQVAPDTKSNEPATVEAKRTTSGSKVSTAKTQSSQAGKGTSKAVTPADKPADAPRSGKKRFAREPQATASAKTEPRKAAEAPSEANAAAAPKSRGPASAKTKSTKPAKASSPATKPADAASSAAPVIASTESAKTRAASKPKSRKSTGAAKAPRSTGARTNTASTTNTAEPS